MAVLTRLKIKLDENLSRHLAQPIRDLGHDVDTVLDENLSGRPDEVVGVHVRREGRMLFTLDRWFADLRAYPPGTHDGIIVFRPAGQGALRVAEMIMAFLKDTNLDALRGCLVVVEEGKVRVRKP